MSEMTVILGGFFEGRNEIESHIHCAGNTVVGFVDLETNPIAEDDTDRDRKITDYHETFINYANRATRLLVHHDSLDSFMLNGVTASREIINRSRIFGVGK